MTNSQENRGHRVSQAKIIGEDPVDPQGLQPRIEFKDQDSDFTTSTATSLNRRKHGIPLSNKVKPEKSSKMEQLLEYLDSKGSIIEQQFQDLDSLSRLVQQADLFTGAYPCQFRGLYRKCLNVAQVIASTRRKGKLEYAKMYFWRLFRKDYWARYWQQTLPYTPEALREPKSKCIQMLIEYMHGIKGKEKIKMIYEERESYIQGKKDPELKELLGITDTSENYLDIIRKTVFEMNSVLQDRNFQVSEQFIPDIFTSIQEAHSLLYKEDRER